MELMRMVEALVESNGETLKVTLEDCSKFDNRTFVVVIAAGDAGSELSDWEAGRGKDCASPSGRTERRE